MGLSILLTQYKQCKQFSQQYYSNYSALLNSPRYQVKTLLERTFFWNEVGVKLITTVNLIRHIS